MSPGEWLLLIFLQSVLGVVGVLAWVDLSDKLSKLLNLKGRAVTGGYDPLPEMFVLTEAEAAQAEKVLEAESRDREQLLVHSARNFRRANSTRNSG